MNEGKSGGDVSLKSEDDQKTQEIQSVVDEMISLVEELDNTISKPTPVDIPEILEAICAKMSNVDLLEIRSVSTFWEEEARRTFLKRNTWNFMDSFGGRRENRSGIKAWYGNRMTELEFQTLYTLLGQSEDPELILKTVQVLSSWNRHTEISGCQKNLIEDFGNFVTRLDIQGRDFEHTKKLLDLCPNLKVLALSAAVDVSLDSHPLEAIQSPLKLRDFSFNSRNKVERHPEQFALEIVKNSPELRALTLYTESADFITHCVELLKTLTNVTKNFNKLKLFGHIFNHMRDLAQVEFSSKLKTLELIFYSRNNDGPQFMDFLKLVANSLEILHVEDHYYNYNIGGPQIPTKSVTALPSMPNLKHLALWNYIVNSDEGPDFLKKLPSLKTLLISYSDIPDFLQRACQSGIVLHNLEEFNLAINDLTDGGDIFIDNPTTVRLLNQVFPNLWELRLVLRETPEESSIDEVREWFEGFFHEIAQMKKLENLHVSLGPNFPDPFIGVNQSEEKVDLRRAFENLSGSTSLKKIYVNRSNYKYNFPEELWLMELFNAPMLRLLDFYACSMGEESDKKMVNEFGKRNVFFKIQTRVVFNFPIVEIDVANDADGNDAVDENDNVGGENDNVVE